LQLARVRPGLMSDTRQRDHMHHHYLMVGEVKMCDAFHILPNFFRDAASVASHAKLYKVLRTCYAVWHVGKQHMHWR